MPSIVSRKSIAVTLFLMTCFSGCATFGLAAVPPLEMRTLRISPDRAGLEYQYWVCAEYRWPRKLNWCKRTEMKVERYDLTDPVKRKQLIDMGFVARVREKP